MIHNGNALNILALETATNACSVAVWRNGKIAAQLTLRRTRMHDAQLVPMIGDALRYAGIAAADLAAVAVSSGPGSYTGLRIGTATAKGLAEATGAQLVSVPGPEAWAHLALPLAVPDDHIVAAFDARRNEAYAAAFLVTPGSALKTLRETSVIQVEEAAEWLGNPAKGRLYIVGDGQTKLYAQLAQRHGANGHAPEILAPDDERIAPASVAVARLGAAKFERGEVEDIASFEPHYLKEFAAAVPEKQRSKNWPSDMTWFKRQKAGILTELAEKNEIPDGQWAKCPKTGEIVNRREIEDNAMVVPASGYHFFMDSLGYFRLLYDDGDFELFDENLYSTDPLEFADRKRYADRLDAAKQKTGLNDAARAALGKVGGHLLSAAAMDFAFIGGSMGSVVGEVVARAIKRAEEKQTALLIISQSGGARMMEGALSLMQMAKTSALLSRLDAAGLPFISLMTNPTTGGVTASFAMLGDFNLAEPGALIGFAGPRVIRETIGADLPDGFQSSEFLQEHGFVDFVVDRRHLREQLIRLLDHTMQGQS